MFLISISSEKKSEIGWAACFFVQENFIVLYKLSR